MNPPKAERAKPDVYKRQGRFYYSYVIVDVYSRMVVSARVFEADNADFAARFLGDAFRRYGIKPGQLVVHSDNGASMKAGDPQVFAVVGIDRAAWSFRTTGFEVRFENLGRIRRCV